MTLSYRRRLGGRSSRIGPGVTEFPTSEASAQAVASSNALRSCGERATFKGNKRDSLSAVPAIFPQPDVSLGLRPACGLAPNCLGRPLHPWRSALQERVDVAERSLSAAAHKLEPLNRNRAEPKHENMAGLQKACNEVRYCVRGVMCLIEVHRRLCRRRHLRDVDDLPLVQSRFDGHSGDTFPD